MPATLPSRRARTSRSLIAAGVVASLVAAGCGSDDTASTGIDVDTSELEQEIEEGVDSAASEVESSADDLAQTLRDNGLDSIAGVVEQVDVTDWLGEGDFTFFAPNDEAFMALGADETADLLTDPAQILDILENHTLSGTVDADELASMTSVDTEAGNTLAVSVDGDEVRVGDVVVVATGIEVGGGVIHVVDGLLIP
jgi:uncharacterized surface protein with fasciclin (FAS1) repeats